MRPVILDSEAVSTLARERSGRNLEICRQFLQAAKDEGVPVFVPAAVLQEQYRGGKYTQAVDAFLSRYGDALTIVPTDRELARQAGALQGKLRLDSRHHVDAAIVAIAWRSGGAVILTSDPDDINLLATGLSGIKVVALA